MTSNEPTYKSGGARYPVNEAPPTIEQTCRLDDCDASIRRETKQRQGEWFEHQECEEGHHQRWKPLDSLGLSEFRTIKGP